MAKLKSLVVTVEGRFRFPIDMLRYDNLTPYDSDEAGKITRMSTGDMVDGHQQVKLQGWLHGSEGGPSRVTRGRWDSFGWAVKSVEVDGKAAPWAVRA